MFSSGRPLVAVGTLVSPRISNEYLDSELIHLELNCTDQPRRRCAGGCNERVSDGRSKGRATHALGRGATRHSCIETRISYSYRHSE
jgi:hypothetical protein